MTDALPRSARRFVVVGQVGRDLVLRVDGDVASDATADVLERREMLGGKGANQAVALTQLGGQAALVGAVGEDDVGGKLLSEAQRDGIDVCAVAQRDRSALLVDVVDRTGQRRLYEDIPSPSLATVADVRRGERHVRTAGTVCIQLQQPAETVIAAARLAREAGVRVALDGGIEGGARDEVLALADVVRADAVEAAQLVGFTVDGEDAASEAAAMLVDRGIGVVAIEVPGRGDLVVWQDDRTLLPLTDAEVLDRTGAGDAFFAGLVTGLARGWSPADAGGLASRCASATVGRLGGRPDLRQLRPV